MKDNSNKIGSKLLLEEISGQAELEASVIASEADRQALEMLDGAGKQVDKILQDARKTGQAQKDMIKTRKMRSFESDKRKMRLKVQEELFTIALDQVREKIGALRERSDYADILKGWIVEGAMGLGRDIIINASGYERGLLTEEELHGVEEEITRVYGKKYSIKLSSDPPVSSPGILISAENGRLVFNNLVESRLQRHSHAVRKMIYRYIQAEDADEVKRG